MTLRPYVRAEPIPVDVGPLQVTVPAMTAAEWLWLLCGDRLTDIVPGALTVDERSRVAAALVDGTVTAGMLADAARSAVQVASDRPWWSVFRLVAYAQRSHGELFGALLLKGVDPAAVTLPAWCSALVAMVRRTVDEKTFAQFETDLMMPPTGVELSEAAAVFDGVTW